MKNKKSLKDTSRSLQADSDFSSETEYLSTSTENMIAQARQNAGSLSYEESLKRLDAILSNLQDENLPLTNLQHSYLEAKIYLEHCEFLLNTIEQEVVNIEPEDLIESTL